MIVRSGYIYHMHKKTTVKSIWPFYLELELHIAAGCTILADPTQSLCSIRIYLSLRPLIHLDI